MRHTMIIKLTLFRTLLGLMLMLGYPFTVSADTKGHAKAQDKPASTDSETPLAPLDKPLIKVNEQPITTRDYIGFLQAHPDIIARAADTDQGKAEAYRELVMAFLLQKAMFDEGLLKKGEQPSQQSVVAAYETLAERHFPLPPNPDDAVGFAYYQSHQEEFGIPPMVRVNEILFKVGSSADTAVAKAARDRAEKALERLKKGEPFAPVAKEMTEDPIGRVTSGDMGFIDAMIDLPTFNAVKALKVGDRTEILRSASGFIILEVTEVRPGLISPYANIRDKVIKQLRDQKQKELRTPYVKMLARDAKIEIMVPDLKALFPRGIFAD